MTPRRSRTSRILVACVVCGLFAPGAVAQDGDAGAGQAQQHNVQSDDKPYDDKLLRLSEILGALHYLRELCGAGEGQKWREQMNAIVDAEGTTAIRRARLVRRFNRGYRGFRRTYHTCNDSALLAINRFMQEGADLTGQLTRDYR